MTEQFSKILVDRWQTQEDVKASRARFLESDDFDKEYDVLFASLSEAFTIAGLDPEMPHSVHLMSTVVFETLCD